MLEANYLTILLKPNYEKPIDNAQDVIDRGLNLVWGPGQESYLDMYKNSPSINARKLAERTVVAKVIIMLYLKNSILILFLKELDTLSSDGP